MGNLIFLVGFMGSGKTTMAKKLSNHLGLPFMDLDQLIVAQTGQSIPDYFKLYGEEAFREFERDVLRGLDTEQKAIVSVGGGTPCFFDNMEWMNANGETIYLRISPKGLWQRLANSKIEKRPVLKGLQGEDLLAFIVERLRLREPYYLQAKHTIEQMKDSVEDIIWKCDLDRFRESNSEEQ